MKRWYALAAALLAIDQATKWVAEAMLRYGESVQVLPFLSWTRTCNTGAAFSILQGASWAPWALAAVAVAVAAYVAVLIWRLRGGWLEGACYGLILAGALGNLTDRVLRQCVVDFVHVHYGWFNFPIFNVADAAITVGAAGWIWLLLFAADGAKPGKPA